MSPFEGNHAEEVDIDGVKFAEDAEVWETGRFDECIPYLEMC